MNFYITENQRKNFQSFKDVDHLNKSIRAYTYKYKKELHNANTHYQELNVIGKVFKAIYTHSLRFTGVSFLSNKTIAAIVGISVRSVRRATRQLLDMGIILKLFTKRQNGSDTTNTIIIKPLLASFVDKLIRRKKTPCPPPLSSLESRSFKQDINIKDLSIVNKEKDVNNRSQEYIDGLINDLATEYRLKGLNKTVCLKAINEAMENIDKINNLPNYLRGTLENTLYKVRLKTGQIDAGWLDDRLNLPIPMFNWLES